MWKLEKSRGMFFTWTHESPSRSFWVGESHRLLEQGISPTVGGEALTWNPSGPGARSNCPILHDVLNELVSLVRPEWRARASAIYAGRTSKVDGLAYSKHAQRGGVVVIGQEYSVSLIAYTGAWARFLSFLDLQGDVSPQDWRSIEVNMRADLNDVMTSYRQQGVAALARTWPLTFKGSDAIAAATTLVAAAERWVVAHELAHHVLRHGTSRVDKQAVETVRGMLRGPTLAVEMQGMNRDQVSETEADLLAFELLAGRFARETDMFTVIQAIQGSALALIAVGHLESHWTTEPGDSHPGALTRLSVLAKWAATQYGEVPLHLVPGHAGAAIHRLVALLVAYAIWASGLTHVRGFVGAQSGDYVVSPDLPLAAHNFVHLSTQLSMLEMADSTPLLDYG